MTLSAAAEPYIAGQGHTREGGPGGDPGCRKLTWLDADPAIGQWNMDGKVCPALAGMTHLGNPH